MPVINKNVFTAKAQKCVKNRRNGLQAERKRGRQERWMNGWKEGRKDGWMGGRKGERERKEGRKIF